MLPLTFGGDNPPPAPCVIKVTNKKGKKAFAGAERQQTAVLMYTKPLYPKAEGCRVGAVFDRLWESDMRCKNRAKGGCGEINNEQGTTSREQ